MRSRSRPGVLDARKGAYHVCSTVPVPETFRICARFNHLPHAPCAANCRKRRGSVTPCMKTYPEKASAPPLIHSYAHFARLALRRLKCARRPYTHNSLPPTALSVSRPVFVAMQQPVPGAIRGRLQAQGLRKELRVNGRRTSHSQLPVSLRRASLSAH